MKTILVVEDDKAIASALKIRLTAAGYDIHVAHDAVTAGIVARRCNPEIALLDIGMPGGSGFDVAERLQGLCGKVAIIFLTANSRAELRVKAQTMGADAFFEKPFSSSQLIDTIESLA